MTDIGVADQTLLTVPTPAAGAIAATAATATHTTDRQTSITGGGSSGVAGCHQAHSNSSRFRNIYQEFIKAQQSPSDLLLMEASQADATGAAAADTTLPPHTSAHPAAVTELVGSVQAAHTFVQDNIRRHIAVKTALQRMQTVQLELEESVNRLRNAIKQFASVRASGDEEPAAQEDGGAQGLLQPDEEPDDTVGLAEIEAVASKCICSLRARINSQTAKVKGSECNIANLDPLIRLLGNPSNAHEIRYREMYTV